MHAIAACAAVITTSMRLPSVLVWSPWPLALLHQVFFALLGLLALMPGSFVVYVCNAVCRHRSAPAFEQRACRSVRNPGPLSVAILCACDRVVLGVGADLQLPPVPGIPARPHAGCPRAACVSPVVEHRSM